MSDTKTKTITTLNRYPDRGSYDKEIIYNILDSCYLCNIGFVDENANVFVMPTMYVRIENKIYIHGSIGSRMMKALSNEKKTCITVSIVDGLVLAKSAFSHSLNYRSVVIFSNGQKVTKSDEKYKIFAALTNKILPKRWENVRQPTEHETKITEVIAFNLDEASAKTRTGFPVDKEMDQEFDTWSGIIPCEISYSDALADSRNKTPLPMYIKDFFTKKY
ncbi:pyridoxamine 5'-phosphate oxidase family protein [Pigmentibacter sp. JX0631]|uniref:pyridoxamine 5'-phosphate oxidase family protein n=1 Tax=Pigmentibacter sp. JX0631 TaxID=2976982 RepID=UPI0024694D08|nr:pyridoxamine 5'-phosphate oxidase family protein [Pigmentibacter sp. JX0631]WGL58612.1 pyridoxamine 5'-phosphate oxidase family protein [Pigmentibacter sp. JX0631]